MKIYTYRVALFLYILLFSLLTYTYWGNGEVVGPNRQLVDLSAYDKTSDTPIENRKFGDFTQSFIPEISVHLKGDRSSWLTLWNKQNELGRPLYHLGGFSRAYSPALILSALVDNPWQYITIISLWNAFLAGLFIFLYCREIELNPLAGLIAAMTLASSPFFMYWMSFPTFLAIFCWAAGALWAVTRLAKKPELFAWTLLAFSTYSLLLTARPQGVIYQIYLLIGFALVKLFYRWKVSPANALQYLGILLSATLVGAMLTLPIHTDLYYSTQDSLRTTTDHSFFTAVLPKISTLTELFRFSVLSTTPELFGNPSTPDFPLNYNGLSLTPISLFFLSMSVLTVFKKTWGWWLAVVVICLFTFNSAFYTLGLNYLGFNLSRSNPLGSITLPLTLIIAYSADALIKRSRSKTLSSAIYIAVAVVLASISAGVYFGFSQTIPIHWDIVLLMLILLGLLAAQHQKTCPHLVLAALILMLATLAYPLMQHQDPSSIATTSPLVEKIRANVPTDSRYAIATPGLSMLPPNINAELGIASIHSYNSLSSKRYHRLIAALGGEVQTYGRLNTSISPDYNSPLFWMSNISVMLSPTKLYHENLAYIGEESGVYLYKVIARMGESLQILATSHTIEEDLHIKDPRIVSSHSPVKRIDQGDLLEFEVVPSVESVLILSQKYHHDWQAEAFVQSHWTSAKTTVINGVFQGVLIPKDAQCVRLQFKPYVRYAWIAHVFWLIMISLIGFKTLKK